jgi:hypothetical protein
MKKEVREISTLTLLNLDPEVVFHTNDVTLNSSIVVFDGSCSTGIKEFYIILVLNIYKCYTYCL